MKFSLKKVVAFAGVMLAGVALAGCGGDSDSGGGSGDKGYVGIAMPTKSAERWIDQRF